MKGLLWLIVLAALAVALSLALRGSGGYALFVMHPWRAEISLTFIAVLVVVGFALGYLLVRAVWHTLRLPSLVRAYRKRRRYEAGHAATLGAIQALFEGRFVRAEKLASKAIDLGAPGLAVFSGHVPRKGCATSGGAISGSSARSRANRSGA
jgi:HemY protein